MGRAAVENANQEELKWKDRYTTSTRICTTSGGLGDLINNWNSYTGE